MTRWFKIFLAFGDIWVCASCTARDPEVVRPSLGEPFLPRIPGPVAGGGYDSFSHALMAACQKILSKPGASAGLLRHQDFITRWMLSTEYCAWIYYTPEHKHEISRLTDQSSLDPSFRYKKCALPAFVDDPRYPPATSKSICAIHNHPYGTIFPGYCFRVRTTIASST